MKKNAKKGFTLAELLIVVAIIAVLIAIMFPVFGAQLDKAKAAAELANVRAKYAELVADAMIGKEDDLTATVQTVEIKMDTLGGVLQNKGSKIVYTPGADGADGTIEVWYGTKYHGSFTTDGDVLVKEGSISTLDSSTGVITYIKNN